MTLLQIQYILQSDVVLKRNGVYKISKCWLFWGVLLKQHLNKKNCINSVLPRGIRKILTAVQQQAVTGKDGRRSILKLLQGKRRPLVEDEIGAQAAERLQWYGSTVQQTSECFPKARVWSARLRHWQKKKNIFYLCSGTREGIQQQLWMDAADGCSLKQWSSCKASLQAQVEVNWYMKM